MTVLLQTDLQVTEADELAEIQKSPLQKLLSFIHHQPLGAAGALIVIVMIFMALFADLITVYDPEVEDFTVMLVSPNLEHWLGTDNFGRDVFTRIIYGARTALLIGFVAALSGSFVGLILGVASAYFSGKIDLIFQRILDIFLSIPLIIAAIAIVAILGSNIINVILAISIVFAPRCARVVRSSALSIREMPYVDAARALGFNHIRIIMRHMIPNVMAPYLIMLTSFLGQAILTEASLSYLGLGVQEPVAAWGLMLQGGAEEFAESAPWVAIFPGLAIAFSVFAFNLFGDALRDVLDPKLRTQ